ncbi:hypothetical protein [Brevibacillus sp. VP]|uniref:hypothetical protein n=1 Tax=unclassified Brevibacillus TaxID=2684853 RepID=UPI001F46E5BF|nr:hypothetical protein [Brevibacillus sp. VP]
MGIESTLQRHLLNNTGFFEGHDGYSNIAGRADGMGLSFGILQFNFGKKTLQPILEKYIKFENKELYSIFGKEKGDILSDVIFKYSAPNQVRWAESISPRGEILEEWKKPFQEMGQSRKNQGYQQEAAQPYVNRAELFCEKFGIKTTQGLAFIFDHIVQTWDFPDVREIQYKIRESEDKYRKAEGRELPDEDRLSIILDYIPERAHQRLRRATIKEGVGNYLGKYYDITDFGYGILSYYSYF